VPRRAERFISRLPLRLRMAGMTIISWWTWRIARQRWKVVRCCWSGCAMDSGDWTYGYLVQKLSREEQTDGR
jgi:hypothetical protein